MKRSLIFVDSLEDRVLFCGADSDVYKVPVPATPVSTLVVDIEPAARCGRGVSVKTTTNGGSPVTVNLSRVPSKFDITAPQIAGLHSFTVTIGNVNALLTLNLPDNGSSTASVTTSGADVIVNAGDNGANFISVTGLGSYQCGYNDDLDQLPVEINGGQNALNQMNLVGSGIIFGGQNSTNLASANGDQVVFVGADNGSNIFTGGNTGQYFFFGGDNCLNDFTLGGGFNYVVGGSNSNNNYRVADAGRGVIIFGTNAGNNLFTQSALSLTDYCIITNPHRFHCGDRNDYGDDDNDCNHNDNFCDWD